MRDGEVKEIERGWERGEGRERGRGREKEGERVRHKVAESDHMYRTVLSEILKR